mmetsp:Transcript_42563/g.102957  ORF Transcript_42563/g.102957 Transcript_42563/m.102957 type:complete len:217 (-) Transcript_42563:223-873(-)
MTSKSTVLILLDIVSNESWEDTKSIVPQDRILVVFHKRIGAMQIFFVFRFRFYLDFQVRNLGSSSRGHRYSMIFWESHIQNHGTICIVVPSFQKDRIPTLLGLFQVLQTQEQPFCNTIVDQSFEVFKGFRICNSLAIVGEAASIVLQKVIGLRFSNDTLSLLTISSILVSIMIRAKQQSFRSRPHWTLSMVLSFQGTIPCSPSETSQESVDPSKKC